MAAVSTTKTLPDVADKPRVVEEMFDRIAPRYDLLNRVITFRLDNHWRRETVRALQLSRRSRVLDLACGTGDLTNVLEAAGHDAVGLDFSSGMLRAAHTNAALVRGDAMHLPFANASFDAITCGFGLRNFVAIAPVLKECARILKPAGRVAMLEVAEPSNRIVRVGHGVWFRHVVPFMGGLLSDKAAYRYLPASTAYLPEQAAMLAMLDDAGLVDASTRTFGLGAISLVVGARG
jgi:demethylmenaquinone methyltransferase/2-methoxy-6-polyprenyl-1,4-benzoquinol methylase